MSHPNYINRLQNEVKDRDARLTAGQQAITDFKAYITTNPKFLGHDGDGERKDWISTTDLNHWLSNLRDTLYGMA